MSSTPHHSKAKQRKIKTTLFLISLICTVAIFIWIFSKIDLVDVKDLILNADKGAVIGFFIASLATSFFRAWRYSVLLGAVGYSPKILSLYLVTLVRNLFSDLLPARIGTLMYVYLVTTRLGVPLGAASSSFALAFIFDFVALAPLIVLATFSLSADSLISPTWLLIGGLVFALVSVVALLCLPKVIKFALRLFQNDKFRGLGKVLAGPLDQLDQALTKTLEAKIYFQALVLSIFVRLGKYLTLYLLLYAMLKPIGYTFETLQFSKVFIGLISAELAASLPISGPAGLGAYQGAWALAFQLLGFTEALAKSTSVSHHLFTQAYGYSLGLLAMLIISLPFFKVTEAQRHEVTRVNNLYFACRVAIVSLLIGGIVKIALEFLH